MNKILISDYDNTFYINDKDIKINTQYLNEYLKNKNKFIIATGRSFDDLIKEQEKYNFHYNYAILNHGATIIDNNKNIIENINIEKPILKKLKETLRIKESEKYFCCNKKESRLPFNNNISKINIKYKDKQTIKKVIKELNENYKNYINVYYISTNCIEIISNKASKINAIKKLTTEDNKENIYTIGDSYSDIEMIKEYNGYRMSNCIEELKEITNNHVDSVSELIKILN